MVKKPFWENRNRYVAIRAKIPWKQWQKLVAIRKEFGVTVGEQVRVLIAHGLRKPVKKL